MFYKKVGILLGGLSDCEELVGLLTGDDGETKKEYGENDEYMFHRVSYKWIRKTQVITSIGLFYKKVGRLWKASNREDIFRNILRWY